MSLEQEIANLTAACNRLTEETIKNISTAEADLKTATTLFSAYFITVPTIIPVGPTRAFTRIQDAWDSLLGKIILAPVTIQIDAGNFKENLRLSHQPYAYNIQIRGAGLDQTVIQTTQAQNQPDDMIMYCQNVRALVLSDFTLEGAYDPNNTTDVMGTQGVFASHHSYIYITPGTVKIKNCWTALYANATSAIYSPDIMIEKGRTCVVADGGCINVENSHIIGAGQQLPTVGVYSANSGYIVANKAQVSEVELGFQAERSSFILAYQAKARACRVGFHTVWGGSLFAHESSAEQTESGYSSEYSSSLFANASQVSNSTYGYCAKDGGVIYAVSTQTQDCYYGYFAQNLGLIEAFNTTACAQNITQLYTPPLHATLGNDNGMIRWS